jgi:hypothetical protein
LAALISKYWAIIGVATVASSPRATLCGAFPLALEGPALASVSAMVKA